MSAVEVVKDKLRDIDYAQSTRPDYLTLEARAICLLDALGAAGYVVVAAGEITRLEARLAAAQAAQYTAQAQASHR